MRGSGAVQRRRTDREFEAYVAGAAPRLLRTAALLTTEPPEAAPLAGRLLELSLARTYAAWGRLRRGEDPYEHTRSDLVLRFARSAWRHRGPRGGPLSVLEPRARLVLVLRLYEGVAAEQIAALLALPEDLVEAVCAGAVHTLLHPPRAGGARHAGPVAS